MPLVDQLYKDEVEVLKDYLYNFKNARIAFSREEHVMETIEKALKQLQEDLEWLKDQRWNIKHTDTKGPLKGSVYEKDDEYDLKEDFLNYKKSMVANVEQVLGYLKVLGKIACWVEDTNMQLEAELERMQSFDQRALGLVEGTAQEEVSRELSDLQKIIKVISDEDSQYSRFMKTIHSMIEVLTKYQQRLASKEQWDKGYVDNDLLKKTKEQMEFLRPLLKKWGKEFFSAKKEDKKITEEFSAAEQMIKGLEMEKNGAMQKFEDEFKKTQI